ncbi:MAG: hypothetical protein HQ517_01105 [SAR324 cluster bacterium]|nr:hypothetical protein [SAR324 cluster bacterium]
MPCDDIIKQYEEAELDEKARNDRNISCTFFLKFDFFTLTVSSNLITNASSLVSGKKELEDSISRVRSFISDDEHYLRW